jgi:hypothetical protein
LWHHIVAVRDSNSKSKKIYVDGKLNASSAFDDQPFQNNLDPVYIGASVCETARHDYFQGDLDDVLVYNRALSEAEIQELYSLR